MRVWRKHQVKSRKLVELIVELIFNSHFLPTYIIYKLNVFVHGENANSYSFLPLCSLLKATFATVVKYFSKTWGDIISIPISTIKYFQMWVEVQYLIFLYILNTVYRSNRSSHGHNFRRKFFRTYRHYSLPHRHIVKMNEITQNAEWLCGSHKTLHYIVFHCVYVK